MKQLTKQPWIKFYPSDWRADPALRVCSLAARGLWFEMLCLMHEAQPYGYLVVNGRPVTDRQLASLVGCDLGEISGLLDELRSAGVFDEEGGIIVSRRMVRDQAKALRDQDNGKNGGNPHLKPKNDVGVNPTDNAGTNGGNKAQKPESRDQNLDQDPDKIPNPDKTEPYDDVLPERRSGQFELSVVEDGNPKPKRRVYPADFEQFWKPYPKGDGNMPKAPALKAWKKLSADDRAKAVQAVPAFVAYCASRPDYSPCYAQKFLNERRFDDYAEKAENVRRTAAQFVRVGTPEWRAWEAHHRSQTGRGPPVNKDGSGWFFPSQWPPQSEVAA